ncbi:MAG: iron ABC transporter permease [Alphaproteobacteria bacterium]|nr:iron ABC transporter permease [Alphaproteobacteria bacterium]
MSRIFKSKTVLHHLPRDPEKWTWCLVIIIICAIALTPMITLAIIAINPSENVWPHLIANVLPDAIFKTIVLLSGVGICTLFTGTLTAWLVTMYRFPGCRVFEWLLPAPLAAPAYIIAYCYVELFDYAGPLHRGLGMIFSEADAIQKWFPEMRSVGGAIFVMSVALYPYIYLTARAAFLNQSGHLLNVGRTLGCTKRRAILWIALPLARPALIGGLTLTAMETINDIGVAEFFGVQTITLSVYSTWLGRGSLTGAAQLSLILLLFIFALIQIESLSRQRQRFYQANSSSPSLTPREKMTGKNQWIATGICSLPITLGLLIPLATLAGYTLPHLSSASFMTYLIHTKNSLLISSLAAMITVITALLIGNAKHLIRTKWLLNLSCIASIGYAIPGTVMALGILMSMAALDNIIDSYSRSLLGISTGLLLSGSLFAVILAYVIRFLAMATASIEASMKTLSPHISMAARTMGHSASATFLHIQLPLIHPAIATAILLVFVDGMKELPITLLLRPFDLETLATHIYSYASMERFEDTALSALTIVLISLGPAIFLNRVTNWRQFQNKKITRNSLRQKNLHMRNSGSDL